MGLTLIWIFLAYVSGSIPWSLILGKIFSKGDVRTVGDGNPGSANAWKLSGPLVGLSSLFLDIGKGFVPAYLFIGNTEYHSTQWTDLAIVLVLIAPILGHAWSPFLRFKGGKALATTWGVWIAATNLIALPVGCIVLAFVHGVQKNHAITVTLCVILFIIALYPLYENPYIAVYGILNLMIVIWKHKSEYSAGIIPRSWTQKAARIIP